MINSTLVKIFTDGDSAMFHPQTGERLTSDCESYYFYVNNPVDFIFTQDYSFNSPSAASGVIQGRSSNGRKEWKEMGTNQTYAQWQQKQVDNILV